MLLQSAQPMAGGTARNTHLNKIGHLHILHDVLHVGRMILCKNLPQAHKFIVPDEEDKAQQQCSAYSKRQRIDALSSQAFEPEHLSEKLFALMRISHQSLAQHLRPGKYPR